MFKRIKNAVLLSMVSVVAFAQQRRRVGDVNKIRQEMNQATEPVMGIIDTVANWLYGIIGVLIVLVGILILTTNSRGDDKIMKLGNLLVVLISIGILVFIADVIF